MKRFPNADEWDKIVNDAFNSDETHIFSDSYNTRKYKMKRSIAMKKHISKKRLTVVFAVAAAMTVLVPTTVYAYNRYTASITKTAKYQNTVKIDPVSEPENTEKPAEKLADKKENEQLMKYELGWIPEGFVKSEKGYSSGAAGGRITLVFLRVPDDKLRKGINIDLPNSDNCENYETDGKTAMINYRVSYCPDADIDNPNNDENYCNNFGREIWVKFNDTNYLLQIYLTDDISREDTLKMLDNIKLVPTDEVCFGIFYPQSDNKVSQDIANRAKETEPPVDPEKINMKHVGETGSYNVDEDLGCDITLNSAEITDSLEGIHTDGCGWDADYSKFMDENGNIIENTRGWIKRGDGVNTIDEVVSEENVPMHVLKVNATITNNLNETTDYCICPELLIFNDNVPKSFWEYDEETGLEFVDSLRDRGGIESGAGHFFSFNTDPDKKGSKNHVILEPGESADIELAFLVAEDELDRIYLNFYTIGNSLSNSINNGYPLFDVRH